MVKWLWGVLYTYDPKTTKTEWVLFFLTMGIVFFGRLAFVIFAGW